MARKTRTVDNLQILQDAECAFNLDEVIGGGLSKKFLATLEHATEISRFVTERTLGPDKTCWRDAEEANKRQQQNQKLTKDDTDEAKQSQEVAEKVSSSANTTKKTTGLQASTTTTTKTIRTPPILQQPLDYESITSSVLLREAEEQRRRAIRQHVIDMQQQRLAKARRNAELERQRRAVPDTWLQKHRRSDALIIEQAEKQAAIEHLEQEKEIEKMRQQFERQLHVISFQGVSTYQRTFRAKYESIAKLLMSIDKEALLSCTEYNRQLKELIQMFEQLIGKIKAGECGQPELKNAENLCKSLDALEESIIIELENIVKREKQQAEAYQEAAAAATAAEEKRKQEQQLAEQQKQKQDAVDAAAVVLAEAAATVVPPPQPASCGSADSVSQEPAPPVATTTAATTNPEQRLQFYFEITQFYQEKVEQVKPLQSDDNMKKWRFACQKAINFPVNAISAVSREHLLDKFDKLYSFIAGQPVKTGEGQISVNDHPLGRDYCLLLMAKKFVSQGDTAISSNAQAAFPVASVIVTLWKLLPDFGRFFLAYIYKESPFLVPYLVPQQQGQSLEEYFKVLGYRLNAEGQVENQEMYLKRQAGIARLYAAVMVTGGRQLEGTHPYGLEHGWRWMASFLCFEPLPDISATLLVEVLQIAGADMWKSFGKQFAKLLLHLQLQYLPRLAAVDKGGPKARLELMLRKCLSEGQIARAPGMLSEAFW